MIANIETYFQIQIKAKLYFVAFRTITLIKLLITVLNEDFQQKTKMRSKYIDKHYFLKNI